jgi:hypothetical protein
MLYIITHSVLKRLKYAIMEQGLITDKMFSFLNLINVAVLVEASTGNTNRRSDKQYSYLGVYRNNKLGSRG